jgi:hypothetical protein
MKRSGQVGLAVMGVAAFAATYASVAAYRAGTASTPAQSAAQTCTTRPDGTQNCEPARRGFAYYMVPHFVHGWWGNTTPAPKPAALAGNASALTSKSAALTNTARATTPAVSSSGVSRGGFGTTAQSNSFRVSAGG